MADRSAYLQIALDAVKIADNKLRDHADLRVSVKGDRDYVSNLDVEIEQLVRSHLAEVTPDIGFFGEEHGGDRKGDRWWCLDPIDGTVNFVRGSPLCAVSLALVEDDQPTVGVVSLPFLNLTYEATLGQGAHRNGQPIHVSDTTEFKDAIVAIGDYAVGDGAIEKNRSRIDLTERLANRVLRIRMHGSAAIDLVWLADGKIDATIIVATHPWDIAAGVIIAREAGAHITDLTGTGYSTTASSVIGTTPALAELIELS